MTNYDLRYFKKFNSVDREYINTDKHIHSVWTDGCDTIAKIAKKAKDLGLRHIAIVDHIRKNSVYFTDYCNEIAKVAKKFTIDILTGFEAKVEDFLGNIDVSEEVVKKAQIRVASVHRFPIGRKLYLPKEFKKRICQEIELELIIAAIKSQRFNVIGHPGGMSLQIYHDFPMDFFDEIIIECKKNNVAFEINGKYHLAILKDLKRLLRKHNPFVSLGSDAHSVDDLGKYSGILRKVIFDG
jgi:histidinol phosphatase-like PHP family hydrolase